MRYKCPNKECGYKKRQGTSWKWKGKVADAPLNCPECHVVLKRYKMGKVKGDQFERDIAEQINLYFDLKGNDRVTRNVLSGGGDTKGDQRNLPTVLKQFVIECKNWDKPSVGSWWAQTLDEAYLMSLEPMMIFKLKGNFKYRKSKKEVKQTVTKDIDDILVVRRLKIDLKLLAELRKLRSKQR